MLDPHVWWPVFPLLLLVVVVCLTWATVYVVRKSVEPTTRWMQIGAFLCYILAAVAALASEAGILHANVHRPFSILTQVGIVVVLVRSWKIQDRALMVLNGSAWAGILADTAFHFIMVR